MYNKHFFSMFYPKNLNLEILKQLAFWAKEPGSAKWIQSSICHDCPKWLLQEMGITDVKYLALSQSVVKNRSYRKY